MDAEPTVLTVTLNAALDLTYRVPRLVEHREHRVSQVSERPGGKGLNVARVLAGLGYGVTVTGLVGGASGGEVRRLLADSPQAGRLRDELVTVAGPTRRTVGVVDDSGDGATQLNEPGPGISPGEWSGFLDRFDALLSGSSAVALCGSLPPGVPVGGYGQLVRQARAAGVPVVLDTSGEPLRRGLAARPDVVKPNVRELAQVTGTADPTWAAREARRRGAHRVVVSLGEEGLLGVSAEGSWRARPSRRLSGNPTGAGDAVVAALVSAWVDGVEWPGALARAVALSAASVRAPVAGEFDRELYEELLPGVEVTEESSGAE
ncbi:1-phosphofructokinase family hexose kinase [Streptomyces sp. NPDC005438]|uniref:1-phosphofructokinase family hexose kinase n=1 Tax=Streptomyces sp. NPDC005438 TaxID=3156880 RepID=UPI0033B1202A